jgi:hypothetical protein
MKGRGLAGAKGIAAALALAVLGCATSSPRTAGARAPSAVIVDGRAIPAVHATLLDLLRTSPESSRLLAQAAASGGEPLLIVDGIRVNRHCQQAGTDACH